MKKIIIFTFKCIVVFSLTLNNSLADLQKDLINKITATKTLSFNFKQKIAENEETGICVIKYPLLMKCNYKNKKQKIVISNGKTVAVIKKKYKKIYYYPIKATPLFFILQKERLLNLVRKNKPSKINLNVIEFQLDGDKLKIYFDKNSLELKGWETIDAYSNNVIFIMSNLKINNVIEDDVFKIPKENEL